VRALCIAAAFAALLGLAGAAAAHTRSQSYSTWTRSGSELRVVFTAPAREVARLPANGPEGWSERLAEHLGARLHAWAGDRSCDPIGSPRALDASPGSARAELQLHCATSPDLKIGVDAFFDAVPSHVHFARVRAAGAPAAEYLLTAGARVAAGRVDESSRTRGGTTLPGYLRLGVEHIAGGFDHLAFLVGLLLLCAGIREIVWVATGFTLGHSLTLGLAVLGWVRPEARLVEALIGLTIALVAAESAAQRTGGARAIASALAGGLVLWALHAGRRGDAQGALVFSGLALFAPCYLLLCQAPERARSLRPALTFAFGSIHGFGFASQLLAIGVPEDRVVPALLGFNAGVELGQVAVLAILWGASAWIATRWRAFPRALAADGVTAALCALGLFWFASRSQG
jgi:hypothetical protein